MEMNYKSIENKIFIIPDNSIPITYVSVVFLLGNYMESLNNMGINNLCLKTLIRAPKTMKFESFQYYLEKNSVSLSSSGGNFSSAISVSFPSYNYKNAIYALKEVIFNYGLRQQDIDEVKRDLINSIKLSKDDVWTYLYENADKVFYNSFLSWDTRGTFKTINSISRYNLIKWVEEKIFDKNVKKIMVISGYVSENMENFVYKNFGKFLTTEHFYYDKMKDFDVINVRKTEKLNKKEAGIALLYPAPSLSLTSVKFKLLNGILSSMSGRLFINIREKKELAYAITSSYDPVPLLHDDGKNKYYGNIKILMLTSKDKKKNAIEALKQEIEKIVEEGFKEDELEVAKNYLIGLFSSSLQKRIFKSSLLAKLKLFDIPDEYLFNHLDIIKNTTLDEVNELRKVFNTKESMFVVD